VSIIKISQFINEPWRDVGLDAEKRGVEICQRNGIEKPEANMVMIIGLCDIVTKLEQENGAFRAGKELEEARAKIVHLEDRINRAATAFFRDGSDGKVASGMLTILEEGRNKP
jgi:hypothetical protein